eukprot:scaffold48795_cov18-Tisochrysis_lutea.AAC.2
MDFDSTVIVASTLFVGSKAKLEADQALALARKRINWRAPTLATASSKLISGSSPSFSLLPSRLLLSLPREVDASEPGATITPSSSANPLSAGCLQLSASAPPSVPAPATFELPPSRPGASTLPSPAPSLFSPSAGQSTAVSTVNSTQRRVQP